MSKRVYISYTSDLQNYAYEVRDAINNMGLQAHLWDSHAKRSSQTIMSGMRQLVQVGDFFIGLYDYRYGSVPQTDHEDTPNTAGYSYIHWEYLWAVEAGLVVIPMIMRHDEARGSQREPQLLSFIDELMDKHYCAFFNPDEALAPIAIELLANRLVPPPNSITIQPNFSLPSRAPQYRCDIFMVMPFRDDLNRIYRDEIEPIANAMNKVIKRGDYFQSLTGQIMAEVWHAIYASKAVIVDCTKPDGEDTNGNVYYELGIADVLGKPVCFITQTMPTSLPFDIRHRRMIVYDSTETGLMNLRVQLHAALRTIFDEIENA